MRITFQTTQIEQTQRQTTEERDFIKRIGTGSGYAANISGKSTGNEIYAGQKTTTEQMLQAITGQNVALIHNYMAVMSNTMSEEDFAKLQKDGYSIGSMEVEQAVTIVDRMKAALLEAGVSVAGYTDSIDMETLTEITGNRGLAEQMTECFAKQGVPLTAETAGAAMQALQEAEGLSQPDADTLKYMAANQQQPTVQEVYMAQYSSRMDGSRQGGGYYQEANGYLSKKAEQIHWESLEPQLEGILSEAGLEESSQAREAARWLIETGVPLTAETLTAYLACKQIRLPMGQEELLQAMAVAVQDGKAPFSANLTGAPSLWQQAARIWQRTQALTAQAADLTAQQGKPLTLHHLEAAQQRLEQGYQGELKEHISARRCLEEVRLQMTIAANRELLKSGFAIETKELEQVVEALREIESRQNAILFGGSDTAERAERAALYDSTIKTVAGLPQIPLATVGRLYNEAITVKETPPAASSDFGEFLSGEEQTVTLGRLKEQGDALAAAYQKANERYETFQTMPRSDMGDSIQKAFRSTETLLEELGLEATNANQRAVRILGYNRMEITREQIQKMKEADGLLQAVVRKLTPAAALSLIREGKNPLSMTIEELDENLSRQLENPEQEQEKYSRFLYQLEQRQEISKEERDSYIGIYRLLRQVEKTDGAAIGALVGQGAELSLQNLLSAVRTLRKKGIDATVDDRFGTVERLQERGTAIDTQIEAAFLQQEEAKQKAEYYRRLAGEIYAELDGAKLAAIKPGKETELEELAEQLWQQTQEDNGKGGQSEGLSYEKMQLEKLRQVSSEKEPIEFLRALEEPITINAVLAAKKYGKNASDIFSKIPQAAKQAERMLSHFTDRQEANAAYQEMLESSQQALAEQLYTEPETVREVQEYGLIYKQLSFLRKQAQQEKYDVPIMTQEGVLALHVQLLHGSAEKGTVEASMETQRYGRLSAKLQVDGEQVTGLLIASGQQGEAQLFRLGEALQSVLEQMGFEVNRLDVGIRSDLKVGFLAEKPVQGKAGWETLETGASGQEAPAKHTDKREVSTRELYRMAKAVIQTIQQQAERG